MIRAVAVMVAIAAYGVIHLRAQQAGRGGPPPSPKQAAPIDLTGVWVSVVTEDWRVRMLTAPKGDFGGGPQGRGRTFDTIPYNAEGRKAALAWDPKVDEAEGDQCKAYGAGGVMRQPGRLRVSWEDESTLKMEVSAGTQTRRFRFGSAISQRVEIPRVEPRTSSRQGESSGAWIVAGGRPGWSRGGSLKVVTTNLRPGYYWKNGMPYSDRVALTEHYRLMRLPNGDEWLNVSFRSDDPVFLAEPWIVTYHFKKEPDASKWAATPCSVQ